MSKILSKLLSFLKYILLILAFAITFYGLMVTYKRLEKSLIDAIPVFIPFALVLILFIVDLFARKAKISENLLFNFTSIIVFTAIIIIGIRAKFDTNMILYYKYKIDYNPLYFSDNLSSIKIILYCLAISNVFLLVKNLFQKENTETVVKAKEVLEVKEGFIEEPQIKTEDSVIASVKESVEEL